MGVIESVQREVDMMKQNRKPPIKAVAKIKLLTENAKLMFGKANRNKESTESIKKGYIIYEIESDLPKKYWTEKTMKENLHFRIATRLRKVPGLQRYGNGAAPTSYYLTTSGSSSLKEGKDFTYEITQLTEYIYEKDESLNWDDIQPIEK